MYVYAGRSGTLGAGWTLEAGRKLTNLNGQGRSGMLDAGRKLTNLNVQGRTLLDAGRTTNVQGRSRTGFERTYKDDRGRWTVGQT